MKKNKSEYYKAGKISIHIESETFLSHEDIRLSIEKFLSSCNCTCVPNDVFDVELNIKLRK